MKVAPAPSSDSTWSEAPCASAIERAVKGPRPAPGVAARGGGAGLKS